ncbi:hypothetical protein D7X32_04505 [Corallococcus carmarthensis]|uniref:Uncharacterized protein n=1 Tax=Corallococcus carmarthensis TaxID=2316728 RepID=A0A3A8KH62_9BACT|nr:hypothetical protein D7X32_04505 [Corallococcus carmarthensis]
MTTSGARLHVMHHCQKQKGCLQRRSMLSRARVSRWMHCWMMNACSWVSGLSVLNRMAHS